MKNAGPDLFDLLAPVSPPAPSSDGGSAADVPAEMQESSDCGLAQDAEKSEETTQGDRLAHPVTCPSEASVHWILIGTKAARTACGISMPAYYKQLACGYSADGKKLSCTHNRDDGTVTCERCLEEMR